MRVEIIYMEIMKWIEGRQVKSLRFNERWDVASEGESCIKSIVQILGHFLVRLGKEQRDQ